MLKDRAVDASSDAIQWHYSVCPHDCPDTCRMVVGVRNGEVVSLHGDGDHPVTGANLRFSPRGVMTEQDHESAPQSPNPNGFLCVKVSNYVDRVYSGDRVLFPMRRTGPKGSGEFERISWDQALDEIASRFTNIASEFGPEAILPYSYAGTMGVLSYGSMDRRFFHRVGASLLDRTICSMAGWTGYRYTIGATIGTDPEEFANAKLILLWGTNTVSTNVHLVPFIREAKKRGARVVLIDPHRTRTAQLADELIMPRPGTDGAIALAMMHVIFRDGYEDRDYLDRYTIGSDALRERVRTCTPTWAAMQSRVDSETIERLARDYATTRPAVIRVNYGMQRHSNGGMTMRTISCLPALTGAWRDAAGGVLLSQSGAFGLNETALERPDMIAGSPRTINMVRLGEALTATNDPPVKALFVYNSNPAAVAPEQATVLAGLGRNDLFTVVHEQMLTDTCRYADIVLPAPTVLEHLDLHKSYGHLYVQLSKPVIPARGESVPNTELFRRLASRMGFDEPAFADSDEELVRQALDSGHPWMAGITYERLTKEGVARLSAPRPFAPFAQGQFPTRSGKCELYSENAKRDGFDPLPCYQPTIESPEGSPALARRYPLQLISAAAHHFLNSTFGNLPKHAHLEQRPSIELNAIDARARGIGNGDKVRVFNDRGETFFSAKVGDTVAPGVASHESLWWLRNSPGGHNVNVLTSARLADMGGGATFHSNLVEVERVADMATA